MRKILKTQNLLHFLRFLQGTNTRSATRGTSMGMVIANDIIKVYDGRIIFHSEVGYGTTIEHQIWLMVRL